MITLFLLALANLLLGQTNTEIKSSLNFQNTRLEDVVKEIERVYAQKIMYSSSTVPINQHISIQLKDVTILEAIQKIGVQIPITYKIINGNIVLQSINLKQVIRGFVLDQASQQPVIGATVTVMDVLPLLGAATDVDGRFKIDNVPVGRRNLKVSYVGYEDRLIPNILVGAGKEVVLNLEVIESVIKLEELVITDEGTSSLPENKMAQVSGRSFTVEETKRFAAGLGDPLRLASSFAGVVNSNDNGNEIIVRGNTPRGIMWRLDGVEIPSPNHFSTEGASSGGISMFSTQVVSRSDFFTGAFAPQYGNATSGVFDIRMRNGNNEKPERTVQLGFLGMDVSAEGPFSKGKRSSYLFNYRYSTLGILTKLGFRILDDGQSNIFQDLSLKLNFPTRTLGTFSVFGLGGASSQKQNSTNKIDEEDYQMGVIGFSHQFPIESSSFLRSTFSASGTGIIDDALQRFGISDIKNNKAFKKSFYRASLLFNKKINAHHLLEAGGTISKLNFDYSNTLTNPLGKPPLDNFELLGDAGSSSTIQTYISWKYRISNNLSLVNGLHLFRFDLTGESSLEPRSSLKWQFTPKNSFAVGYGLHSRMESLEYYLGKYINPDLSSISYNRNLGLTKSHHFVLGFDRQISEALYFKSEIYYQHLFNVPVAADKSFLLSTINVTEGYSPVQLINQGTGTNYGLELTLERKFANHFYYLLNTSIYESTYKAADGIERNSRFNGNFSLNLLAGKEFNVGTDGKNNIFGINTKVGFAGNKRYTPIDLLASQQAKGEVRSTTEIYTNRYPDHFRIDLQLSYRRNKGKHTSEWRLDIQNLTNRGNVLNDFYQDGAILQSKGLKLIPVLSYRLEF
jgi:hypothetical protein